ncbi:MAG TPA: SPOR domain-containing protein [Humisphaera sp.]|jgi:TolA-binding protein|nr:SPOR domain-containing protein [Humisphaera sp.]
MRNAQVAWISRIIAMACLAWAAGCTDKASIDRLNQGYHALEAQRYDEAGAAANDYLARHPSGPGAPEAYYLQGRAYEQRASESHEQTAAARADLNSARAAYAKGLSLPAAPKWAALLHTGLANVAYFEDDFATALREWQTAYPNLADDDAKAWALYRIGICQQRLGSFPQADHTFAEVRQQYPGSEAAGRAATRIGAKAFYIQVGAFSDNANAQKLAQSLAQQGLGAGVAVDAGGRYAVRVGPAATYADAKLLRNRVIGQFPQAVILP